MTASSGSIPFFCILGVRVHIIGLSQVLASVEEWIKTRDRCHYIVATQMHGVMEARRDPEFKTIVNSADLFVPDGFSMVWAAKRRGADLKERVPGPDLFLEGCRLATERGYSVFFYGDTVKTLEALTTRLRALFPTLKIAGAHSPPFRPLTPEEDTEEIGMINASNADIVWVGLGLPKQERWMFEHRDKLNVPVLVGVGAAFKFASGQVRRAPSWIGNHGLEWLWRFAQEPRRVWRRVMIDGPRFLVYVAFEKLDSRKQDKAE